MYICIYVAIVRSRLGMQLLFKVKSHVGEETAALKVKAMEERLREGGVKAEG